MEHRSHPIQPGPPNLLKNEAPTEVLADDDRTRNGQGCGRKVLVINHTFMRSWDTGTITSHHTFFPDVSNNYLCVLTIFSPGVLLLCPQHWIQDVSVYGQRMTLIPRSNNGTRCGDWWDFGSSPLFRGGMGAFSVELCCPMWAWRSYADIWKCRHGTKGVCVVLMDVFLSR